MKENSESQSSAPSSEAGGTNLIHHADISEVFLEAILREIASGDWNRFDYERLQVVQLLAQGELARRQKHQRHCPSCRAPRQASSYWACSCCRWHYSTAAGWVQVPLENQPAEKQSGAEK